MRQEAPGPARGRVHVSELGSAFDLLAAVGQGDGFLMERSGLGVGAAGAWATDTVEARAGVDAIRDVGSAALLRLRALAGDQDALTPVAVGVLPFAGGDATLRTHARVVRRTGPHQAWLVRIRREGAGLPAFRPQPIGPVALPRRPFTDVQQRALPPPGDYADAVRAATARIRAGGLRKVVLARQIRVETGRALDVRLLAAHLRAVDPDAYTFVAPTPQGVLVGASPELLVSKRGRRIRSNPLAGSAPRFGDPEQDRESARALGASPKDREEHAIVVEAVAETLRPFCDQLAWDPEPVVLATANVWHLSTRFRGTLRDPAPHVLELVGALHPTPAVCGSPRAVAAAIIDELEPSDRGSYAGPVGWIDAEGDGEWAIALRCAELAGDHATLYAGAGIVAASDPVAEVDETDRKFRAFLDSLRWG
ncbi:MAG: isochorismate synthase [Actinomycetota bacterium]